MASEAWRELFGMGPALAVDACRQSTLLLLGASSAAGLYFAWQLIIGCVLCAAQGHMDLLLRHRADVHVIPS